MHSHLPGPGRRTPVSTYRLQLGQDLTFAEAEKALPYLDTLGVTDLYLSPVLQAAPGSTHGYDVVDHTRISDTMGGREGLERLAAAAHARGMGVVADVVPNHMAVPAPAWHNRALWSVLKHGPESPYAGWFDVDLAEGEGLLMPVLGARIGTVLAAGELVLDHAVVPGDGGTGEEQPVLRYYDHLFPVRPETEDLPLAELVGRQHYRLAYWRVADEELNYRRFFDVGSLAGIRVEDAEVFDATHALLLELFEAGVVDGFRIDHPDGLADPRGYLRRLGDATGGAWVAAEKILEEGEELPDDWPVAGTTGYDTAWRLHALQVDPDGAVPLAGLLHEVTGEHTTLDDLVEEAKRQIVETSLYAETHLLTTMLADICREDVRLRDHTFRSLQDCVTELVVAFGRYRAYVVPGETAPPLAERVVHEAADVARSRLDPDRHDTLDVVVDLVLGREVGSAGRQGEERRAELVVRFPQVCGAVMAKGVEDTAYYRWTHLVSLCEVGGAPEHFGIGPDELHEHARRTAESWPATMTAGSTHDTKRGEDVRSRIGAIAAHANAWTALVRRLREATADLRPADLDGRTENLLWQTLAGTWTPAGPIEADRLTAYLVKAAREQKAWTTWTAPDETREEGLVRYATDLLIHSDVVAGFTGWVEQVAPTVRRSVLATKLLQLTVPGVADVYQGTEVTGTSLVDPDNRRPVDLEALASTLAALDAGRTPSDLAEEKLVVTAAALRLRRAHPGAFVGEDAGYEPLPVTTGRAVAFARRDAAGPRVAVVATRLGDTSGLAEATVVLPEPTPGEAWRSVLTGSTEDGGAVHLGDLLGSWPVALLVAEPTGAVEGTDGATA
ncbi:(1-_4)-alpha-D-glucan 1-alpha-D-glucosylmutase [Promicromonospora umidemergens]|uniref:Malto-oligosyltrehalose synthase n=1 Tax=Promicromonospora umidemergens TaxID=629679 RepID=A0ABP8X7Q5_9MICO|nr:malto-oligosyltrehalose synthase [Promicromonospora umidemergens]MCP2281492.1 (1->4)-alpha-D-glucan 1-alpha-D-glucosylmutase [Promicromonospora umidemergens]